MCNKINHPAGSPWRVHEITLRLCCVDFSCNTRLRQKVLFDFKILDFFFFFFAFLYYLVIIIVIISFCRLISKSPHTSNYAGLTGLRLIATLCDSLDIPALYLVGSKTLFFAFQSVSIPAEIF